MGMDSWQKWKKSKCYEKTVLGCENRTWERQQGVNARAYAKLWPKVDISSLLTLKREQKVKEVKHLHSQRGLAFPLAAPNKSRVKHRITT